MKNLKKISSIFAGIIATFVFIFCFQFKVKAQDRSVSVFQYRHVPDDKIDEFIKRETTYWSKVAQQAVNNKTMTFWALLEKVGGYDLPNSSNYLFVNTFPDIDKVGEVFGDPEGAAGVKMADMETNSISTVTSEFYLHDQGWTQASKAVPENDFKYIVMNYQNSDYADSLVGLENKYWAPFIKKAMDKGQTPQLGWGNAVVLAPSAENIKFTSVSYDLFKNLQDALMPNWDPKTVFPAKGLAMINKVALNKRGIAIYRIVKVVASN